MEDSYCLEFYYSRQLANYPRKSSSNNLANRHLLQESRTQWVCLGKLDQLMPLETISSSLLPVVDDTIASMTTWKGLHLLLHITGPCRRQCKGFVWKAEGHVKYSTERENKTEFVLPLVLPFISLYSNPLLNPEFTIIIMLHLHYTFRN